MYDAAPASDLSVQAKPLQRVRGVARIRFSARTGTTRLADLYQKGSAKVRMPRIYGGAPTAVLINTAGGLTGGDELEYNVTIDDEAHAIVTSQTAERAYRSNDGSAKVTGSLCVGAGATLEWLPQETLLFDRSNLSRTLNADLAPDARLMMLETVVLGRTAMGESIERLFFKDKWRIRRAGKLVFADDIRVDGAPGEILRGSATAAGGHVFATFVDCAEDAGDRLSLARAVLDALPLNETRFAVSAWNDLLVARFVSGDARDLRNALISFLTGYRAADLPRVWYC